ncbi:hypothetical protein GCM10027563_33140 [Parasphingorhabdus pacifica]
MLPGKHLGQVGQPSPEPVTRTTTPVTLINAWVTITARARARIRAGLVWGIRFNNDAVGTLRW